ncbi:hypothetical protein P8C59_001413 [Phyllachora maydis]|uniref:Integrase catalytic domain-containing protein n=1 Tax=Phyllachora maydis TaxID=1825666 RepID=A0AAD9HY48_9PEZI|nr:hypothetical protein P8C59_001413 [Phyllachora maydis]
MADQAKGKGIAPKRASNPADPGQSSRPLPPIRTLLEDEEDSEDYSEVIEVLKQYIKSYERVIASQSGDIKTLLLSLTTLKASVKDSVSAIKNISSTLASLTNSSNAAAATIGKTSYSPRFDPFSSTIDLDSPPHPPRKEPYLGPAVDNTATSNLDPPIDTGSKEGFKDTITSSIVKELSKKAYTILDDTVLLMLLRNSLSSSPRAAISRPIESKKEDVYNEFHALTFSTYKKGLSAFNAEFNGYLAKLTMAKIDIDPSLILNQYFKALESKFPSWVSRQKSSIRQARMLGLIASSLNIEYLMADILEESRNPATEAYRAAHVANSSNLTPNSNSNPSKKGKNKKKGKKKASYNVEGQNYSAKSAEQASFMLGSYNLAIEEEEEESDSSSNSSSSSDSNTQLAQLLALKGYKKRKDFKGKGLKTSSNKAKYKDNKPRRRPRDPALYNSWLYDMGSTDHISNSKERFTTFTPNIGQLRPINTGNGPVSPAGIGSITLEVLSRKAPPTYTKLVLDNVLYLPNIDINIVSGVRHYDSGGCLIKETLYGGDRRCIAVLDFKKSGFFLDVKGSSKPILHVNFAFPLGLTSYNTTKSIEPQRNKIVVEIPSNSIRKEDYRPIIKDAIVSEAIEPNKRYKLRNSPAKGTTLEGIGPSLRGKRPRRPTREPKPLTGTGDLPCMLREPVIEGNKVEKAMSSPTLKEPNIGQRDYYNLLNLAKLWHVRLGHISLRLLKKTSSITKGLPNFDKIKEADFHCSSYDRGKAVRRVSKALIPDLPRVLDLIKGDTVKIRPGPYNRNPIVLLLVNRKSRYRWVFNLPNKSGPIVANAIKGFFRGLRNGFGRYPTKFHFDRGTEITDLLTTWLAKKGIKFSTSAPYIHEQNGLVERSVRVILDQAFLNSALREEIYIEIPKGLLDLAASNKAIYKLLLKYGYNPSTPNIIKLSKALYGLKQSPREWQDKLKILLKSLGYLPLISDPGVFYNAKTCHFIVTYIDNCLFIGPNIGYITDLKKRLNKVYAIEDLGPAAYFLGVQIIRDRPNRLLWLNQSQYIEEAVSHFNLADSKPISIPLQLGLVNILLYKRQRIASYPYSPPTIDNLNSTKDYSICFSCNGNTVADLGPKLSNSSNTTTKLSRDFHSKEGPRPLTTTSTTIVDSRNSKGSSRTSIINSSLVPIGFSDSDFAGDKATSKSTYGYLYKLAGRPISWKTKRATTIALSTLEAETDGLTEAIREVQWIIGLFSELHRPIDYPITLYGDNQGSITVANDPALHARTKHTLLKFRYVREQVKAKIVTIIYLNTKCMPADGLTKALPVKDNTVLSQPTDNTALEGELVDLDLDLEGAVSLDPSNLNTKKPISIEIGPSKLEPYESSSDSELDEPLLDKPINPVKGISR